MRPATMLPFLAMALASCSHPQNPPAGTSLPASQQSSVAGAQPPRPVIKAGRIPKNYPADARFFEAAAQALRKARDAGGDLSFVNVPGGYLKRAEPLTNTYCFDTYDAFRRNNEWVSEILFCSIFRPEKIAVRSAHWPSELNGSPKR